MCYVAAIPLIISAVAGGVSAYSSYQQGKATEKIARNNATMAEYAAQDAVKRGQQDAINVRRRGDALLGAQRARIAASGLDLGVGTQQDIQDQTNFFSATDQVTARNNAAREAWSNRAQGANYNAQGAAAAQQGSLAATGTALGSLGTVANKWYGYTGNNPNQPNPAGP